MSQKANATRVRLIAGGLQLETVTIEADQGMAVEVNIPDRLTTCERDQFMDELRNTIAGLPRVNCR